MKWLWTLAVCSVLALLCALFLLSAVGHGSRLHVGYWSGSAGTYTSGGADMRPAAALLVTDPTSTDTPTPTDSPTATPTPTDTPTATPTATDSPTAAPSPSCPASDPCYVSMSPDLDASVRGALVIALLLGGVAVMCLCALMVQGWSR